MSSLTQFSSSTISVSACLVLAITFSCSQVCAEIVTIDVTVKAVDAKERTITVTKTTKAKSKDIELEVGKKAKILVDGKDAGLDAVKAGQKASVSYESELEVITKIEVGETADVSSSNEDSAETVSYKTTGCRVVWAISENGDSTLTISRPLEKREAAKDGMIRHDDGTVEFQHDMNSQESVDKAMMGGAENVEFDKSRKELVFTPRTVKGIENKVANFTYSKFARLPLTIEYEFDFTEPSGGFPFGLNIRQRGKNSEFPFLNIRSDDDFKKTARIQSVWHASRDAQGKPELQPLIENEIIDLMKSNEFQFEIPVDSDVVFMPEFGKLGQSIAVLRYVSVRGRLVPTMGIGLAEKNGAVIAEKVLPKGLGETVGIITGDVLLSINGDKPKSVKEAMELLGRIQFGEESEIAVKRGSKTIKIGFTAE